MSSIPSRNFLIELFLREEDIVLVIHVEVVWLPGAEGITFGSEHKSTRTNGATELTTAMIIRGVSFPYSQREPGTSEGDRDRRLNTQPLSHLRNKQPQQRHWCKTQRSCLRPDDRICGRGVNTSGCLHRFAEKVHTPSLNATPLMRRSQSSCQTEAWTGKQSSTSCSEDANTSFTWSEIMMRGYPLRKQKSISGKRSRAT